MQYNKEFAFAILLKHHHIIDDLNLTTYSSDLMQHLHTNDGILLVSCLNSSVQIYSDPFQVSSENRHCIEYCS